MEPAADPTPDSEDETSEKQPKKVKKEKKEKKGDNFEKTIGGFFKKLFDEGIDD